MKKFFEILQIYSIVILFIVLIALALNADYYMFKRSHPNVGWLEYLWERSQGD